MFVTVAVALAITSCPFQYEVSRTATVQFSAGSDDISSADRQRISEMLTPFVGNPLVEVEFTTHFPYRDSEISPAYILAERRVDRLRSLSAETGISPDLVGGGVSAIGWTYEGDKVRAVRYAPELLDRADVRFRVKAECHPLTHLARTLDPHRVK